MPVNVFTEWAPLKEVIIGNSINFNMKGFDKVFEVLYCDQIKHTKRKYSYTIKKQYATERQEDLDNFSATLERRGIVVRRPRRLEKAHVIQTPYFKSLINAVDAPRDMFICIGDKIIETPPTKRSRYFEGLMLRHVFMDYFRAGAEWILAPRTRMALDSVDRTPWQKVTKIHSLDEIEENLDILFDAANCLKLGKDIIMNVGKKNHELGAIWLQRTLGDRFKVHPIRICDYHIDGSIIPLKPGVFLINPNIRDKLHLLPQKFQNWKIIEGINFNNKSFNYPRNHLQLASYNGMAINVLSLDENTICVRTEDKETGEILEKEGFTVIPIQMRHCELFGGGLHCTTLDVARDENLAEY